MEVTQLTEMSAVTPHNNSFNPTALSLSLINLEWLRLGFVVSSGGGLIRALGCFLRLADKRRFTWRVNESCWH